jgi:hypothetical protein
VKNLGTELQIILSGELEAADRLNKHLKTQATLIRHNKSREVVASMREATELAEILNHYESQRIKWMEANSWNLQDLFEGKDPQDETNSGLRKIGASLKQRLKEVFDLTVSNAELLGRMVERGRQMLQGIAHVSGSQSAYGSDDKSELPSLFLDQRV